MKIVIYILIFVGGFDLCLTYNDNCEINDLNALMVRLRQLRTEFHNLKEENEKQINANKEEIKHLKAENGKQATEISKQATEISKQATEISKQATEIEKQATEIEKQETEIGKQATEISKQATEIEKQETEIEKQATEISKQATEIEKQETEIGKQATEIGKQATEILEMKAVISNKSTEIAEQAQEIARIKDLFSASRPAFVVRQKDVHYNCTNKTPFEIILLNNGNGFSNTTNHFTAPVAGLYIFTAQLCSYYYNTLDFSIYSHTHDTKYGASRIGRTYTYDFDCRSLTTLAKLTKNEEVYVQVVCPGSGLHEGLTGDNFWPMFTGTLLAPEV